MNGIGTANIVRCLITSIHSSELRLVCMLLIVRALLLACLLGHQPADLIATTHKIDPVHHPIQAKATLPDQHSNSLLRWCVQPYNTYTGIEIYIVSLFVRRERVLVIWRL